MSDNKENDSQKQLQAYLDERILDLFFRAKNPRIEIILKYNTQIICELISLLIDKKVCSSGEIETILRRQQRSVIPLFENLKEVNKHSETAVTETQNAIKALDETVEDILTVYVNKGEDLTH